MIGRLIGPYRVVERLGSGGMGSVFLAVSEDGESRGRQVALKILENGSADASARFRAESAALARLGHPGVAQVYELIEDGECLALAMELVQGRTLQTALDQGAMFSPRQAAELCVQILAALDHIHAAGVVHRDLKPGNVMLTDSGGVTITDFGIARIDDGAGLTAVGQMLGTPTYMAPEQVLGHTVDPRADLYALGILFFRLATGVLPFKGTTPFAMAQAQVNDPPARARDERPDLPAWVDEIADRALQKRPDDRFQSAQGFRDRLASAIADLMESSVHDAVERTEVMARPVMETAPAPAPPVTARREQSQVWLAAAMAMTLASVTWMTWTLKTALWPAAVAPVIVSSAPSEPAAAVTANPAVPIQAVAAKAPATRPSPRAPKTGDSLPLAPVSFSNIKWLTVAGTNTSTADVVVHLSNADLLLESAAGTSRSTTMPYHRIAKATYAHARDPQWDAGLSKPGTKINIPGIFGRDRHWLVLQGVDAYMVLRLDGNDRDDVMRTFEERARVTIDRTATIRKPD